MYVQIRPRYICTGYVLAFTLRMIASFRSGGVSRMLPSQSYSHPWYAHAMPRSSTRP